MPGIGDRPDVDVLLYEKEGRSTPSGALLWIHGGGKVAGSPEQCHATCSRFAGELGLLVVSVDYRLAPEHPFPAGLDDCHTVLTWMHDAAETLGIDQDRIAVGDLDLFHPEDVDYARRLEAAGVECELHEVAGMYHGADILASKAPSMRSFREAMTAALRSAMRNREVGRPDVS